jgi:heptosyltransferase-2
MSRSTMFARLSTKSSVKNIFVISLTNIGDVVMTAPVVDILLRDFPHAKMTIMTGPKAVSLFEGNPRVKAISYDKHATLTQKKIWFSILRKCHFDVVIDLRNTVLPILLMPHFSTFPVIRGPFHGHLKDKHLRRLKDVYDYPDLVLPQRAIVATDEDKGLFDKILAPFVKGQPYALIAPTTADSAKRWNADGFAEVAKVLSERYCIVFSGDKNDVELIKGIQQKMGGKPSLSLAGQTNLRQLGYFLSRSSLAITHDSGALHLASYFNVPTVALFGPTNPAESRPWSSRGVVVQCNQNCLRCLDPRAKILHNCMSYITPSDVLKAVNLL